MCAGVLSHSLYPSTLFTPNLEYDQFDHSCNSRKVFPFRAQIDRCLGVGANDARHANGHGSPREG